MIEAPLRKAIGAPPQSVSHVIIFIRVKLVTLTLVKRSQTLLASLRVTVNVWICDLCDFKWKTCNVTYAEQCSLLCAAVWPRHINSSSNFLYHWFHAGSFILYCDELCRCEVFALLWDHWWIRECVYLYSLSCRIPTGSKPWGFWIGVMRFCLCCIGSITDPCCPGGWGVPELPGMGPAGTAEAWGGAGEGRPLATGVSCFCAMVWFSAHWPGEQRLLVIASSPT